MVFKTNRINHKCPFSKTEKDKCPFITTTLSIWDSLIKIAEHFMFYLSYQTHFFHWNFMHRDCTYLHVHISDTFFSRWKFEHRDILYILMNTNRGSEVASAFDNNFSKLFFGFFDIFFWQFFFFLTIFFSDK